MASILPELGPSGADAEILVIDNGSRHVDIQALLEDMPVVVVSEIRPGIAAAVNTGLAHATGDVIVRTDADCVAQPGWLLELTKPFDDPGIGAVGGTVIKGEAQSLVQRASRGLVLGDQIHAQYLPMFWAPYVVTANAAFRADVLRTVGGFDGSTASAEDVDVCWQIVIRGYRIATAPAAIIEHTDRTRCSEYWRQFYNYALGHVRLFRKYRRYTGQRVLVNPYPFQGMWRLLSRDAPTVVLNAVRRRKIDRLAAMRLWLDILEYSALTAGYAVGSYRSRVWFI